MGTLFDQPERQFRSSMQRIRVWGHDLGFPEAMKPADWHALCDLVRTAIAVQNADVHDEQLAGFGEILRNLVAAIQDEDISRALNEIADAITEHAKPAGE